MADCPFCGTEYTEEVAARLNPYQVAVLNNGEDYMSDQQSRKARIANAKRYGWPFCLGCGEPFPPNPRQPGKVHCSERCAHIVHVRRWRERKASKEGLSATRRTRRTRRTQAIDMG